MKIAFLVVKNIARGGGIEKYTLELGLRLVRQGHQVTVFSMGHYGEVVSEFAGMRIVPVPCIRHSALEKLTASAFAALHLLVKGGAFDVIHFHSVAAGAFAWPLRLKGYRCLLQMHGIEWQRSRWNSFGKAFLRLLEKTSIVGSQIHTAVSKSQCDYLGAVYNVPVHYIPTGADLKPRHPAADILRMGLQPGRYILFASRLVREKGAHYLIEAFLSLGTDFRLVIAGDAKGEEAYKGELQALAGGHPHILFPGFVEGRALAELFSNAALYVQPSEIEGLSIALLEAMSYGNCCLVSDIPENIEAIGDAGFTFRNKDVVDLAEAMKRLLASEPLRLSVAERARKRVGQCYDWDAITTDFTSLYAQLSERR